MIFSSLLSIMIFNYDLSIAYHFERSSAATRRRKVHVSAFPEEKQVPHR